MEYQINGQSPILGRGVYIAPSADVVGQVEIQDHASIWFQAVLRADTDAIVVGKKTNIQDGCVIHVDKGFPVILGQGITVGHKAILHGCTVGDYSLIGINATVLNGAKIGKYCIIGAGALVTEGMVIEDYSLVVGSPAKVIKKVSEPQQLMLEQSAVHYASAATTYLTNLSSNTA